MGAFDFLFKRPKVTKQVNGYFQMLDGYTPVFTTYDGGVYDRDYNYYYLGVRPVVCLTSGISAKWEDGMWKLRRIEWE